MSKLSRRVLTQAIRNAVALFTDSSPPNDDPALHRVTRCIASELELGISKIPDEPIRQDMNAYILSLLATKAIAGCVADDQRVGALRCLYAAAAELRRHRFPQVVDRCLIDAAPGDLEPWPAASR